MFLLLQFRLLQHLVSQIQRLPDRPPHLRFRPDLVNHLRGQVFERVFLVRYEAHVNGPETPVSGGILEEVPLVARSEKDATTRELAGVVGVCRAVSVCPEGEELFDP